MFQGLVCESERDEEIKNLNKNVSDEFNNTKYCQNLNKGLLLYIINLYLWG